jgi:hypothetical protein
MLARNCHSDSSDAQLLSLSAVCLCSTQYENWRPDAAQFPTAALGKPLGERARCLHQHCHCHSSRGAASLFRLYYCSELHPAMADMACLPARLRGGNTAAAAATLTAAALLLADGWAGERWVDIRNTEIRTIMTNVSCCSYSNRLSYRMGNCSC